MILISKEEMLDIHFFNLLLVFRLMINAAFTHTSLTTSYRTKSLYKSIFVLSRPR